MEKEENKKVIRKFGLTNLAVNNKTTVFVLIAIIAVLGVVSYITMPKENFPEVAIPTIYVGTTYPGNSPIDMENLITRPIEKEINSISGVDKIRSTSIQDYSTIIVEFDFDVPAAEALQDVKDAVDKAKSELPTDLDQEPNVFELDFSEFPIMNINLAGNYSNEKLKEYAEYLEDEIEKLPEISKVELRGVQEKEVKVMVDLPKMESLNINFGNIENAIKSENLTMSGGDILVDGIRRSVRILGEFDDYRNLQNIIVKHEKGNIVYLRDIAEIEFGYEDRTGYARASGEPVVMLDVMKSSGENLLSASAQINEIIDKAISDVFPEDLEVSITMDQSQNTRMMVNNLENSIISGVILVVLVLLFFLGLRNALFVGIAIPLSMFTAFMVLGALGVTVNMMVLFALILALGMLVDNGIVVVENVYRLMEEGYSSIKAAKEGVGEVAIPIITSTATTLAAFLPLAFWPGIMGEFMFYLPLTLIIVLASSLFVALVINPVLTASFMRVEKKENKNRRQNWFIAGTLIILSLFFYGAKVFAVANVMVTIALLVLLNTYILVPFSDKFQAKFLPWLDNVYQGFLRFALKGFNPVVFFFGTVGLLAFSIALMVMFTPKVDFFPNNEPKLVNIFIEKPLGTDIEETNVFTKKVETQIAEVLEPYNHIVESVITHVGEGVADPGDPMAAGQSVSPNKARITVSFVEFEFREGIMTSEVMEKIREKVKGQPGVLITVDKDQVGPPTGRPLNIEITGEDYLTLINITERMESYIEGLNIRGIEELKTDLELGKPELIVNVDRAKARRFGVSTSQIAGELRTAIFGKEVSKYKLKEDDYPIQLRLKDEERYDIDALLSQRITFRDQSTGKIQQVPISALVKADPSSTFGSVRRLDMNRVITLYSNILEDYNPTEIVQRLKKELADFEMPEGYSFKFTGEQEKQAEEMSFLGTALGIAVSLILLIIVSQFNSISTPVIILMSVIFSFIGVLLGLVVFQMNFIVIMTMVGIISLAGIVVNNAIVLIDYTMLVIKRRKEELGVSDEQRLSAQEIIDCIVQGGKTRLRPVLLTAITTLLGLIPLATGMNIDYFGLFSRFAPNLYMGGDSVIFWGPIAWTVIFGLTFATFLTLVIVPVMFYSIEWFKTWLFVKALKKKQMAQID